ncbi:MAG TPA: MFS transporter [Actinomycetota bacterium]|nr:MFS transporter [Actinomycetota bacterium]
MKRSDVLRLALLCGAQFLLVLDVVVVNVALPSISADLDVSPARLPLVSISYTLTFGALLVVFGRAGDLFGRRRLFVAGLCVFGLASLLTGAAAGPVMLFTGRALQGLGAAMVSPAALALLLDSFRDRDLRNRAMGMWGAVGSAGAIVGQAVGGTLVTAAGWRSVFLINVPLAILMAAGSKNLVELAARSGKIIDLGGAVLLAGSVTAIAASLVLIAELDFDFSTGVLLLASVALGIWLWRHERRHPAPLLDSKLLSNRVARLGNVVLATNAGLTMAALYFTTLYLQNVLGMSAMAVGLAFTPVTAIVLCVSPVTGRLISRYGVRPPLAAGAVAGCAGLVQLSRVPVDGTYLADVLPGLSLVAVMGGLSYAAAYVAGTDGVPPDGEGLASGLLNTAQELGAALGLAAISALALVIGSSPVESYRAGFVVAAGTAAFTLWVSLRLPRETGRVARGSRPAEVELEEVR